jgi:hypothetical protein
MRGLLEKSSSDLAAAAVMPADDEDFQRVGHKIFLGGSLRREPAEGGKMAGAPY